MRNLGMITLYLNVPKAGMQAYQHVSITQIYQYSANGVNKTRVISSKRTCPCCCTLASRNSFSTTNNMQNVVTVKTHV